MDLKTMLPETATFWSKSYPVDAIRVTRENIHQVAEACGGVIKDAGALALDLPGGIPYIDMLVDNTNGRSSREAIFIGDWIFCPKGGTYFQTFKHEEFLRRHRSHEQRLSVDEQYAKIYQLVVSAMSTQASATFHQDTDGMDLVAIRVTKQILNEL